MVDSQDKLEEFDAIISSLPDKVFVLTESGKYAAIVGGDDSNHYHDGFSLKGLSLFDVLDHDKASWFLNKISETIEQNRLMIFEYSLAAQDIDLLDASLGPSGIQRFEGRVTPLASLRYGERAVVWVARNITNRYEMQQKLIFHSEIDHLSNTYNRRKLFEELNNCFYRYQRYTENCCFILIDIDNFKQINDTLGHINGDKVIEQIADICQRELRQDDLLGRLGGDEFAIIQKQVDKQDCTALAERINKQIQAHNFFDDRKIAAVSVSIGVSEFECIDKSTDDIYSRADIALYKSKHAGKNCCCKY